MSEFFVEEMSTLLDEEKKITHKALSDKVDGKIDDSKFFNKLPKLPQGFDPQQIDWAYGPIIQSGGDFDLRFSATSNTKTLQPGVIIASFGIRYKTYTAAIARTYLVDPSKSQEDNYGFLLGLYETIMKEMRNGAVVKDVYNKALGTIRAKKPDLEKHFVKNIGAGIGIELRDGNLVLNGKNARTLKSGMTLCVMVGFTDIPDPSAKGKGNEVYSLVIADTVRVGETNSHIYTKDAGCDMDSVSFYFGDEEEAQKPAKPKKEVKSSAGAAKNLTKTGRRAERPTQLNEGAEARRREHQKELASKIKKEAWIDSQARRAIKTVCRRRTSSASSPTNETPSFLSR
jgi:nucleosome binding factor SPN SPT16 subunit